MDAATIVPLYEGVREQILEIDARLEAAGDTKSAGRRAMVNGLVTNAAANTEPAVTQFVAHVNSLFDGGNVDEALGLFYGFIRSAEKELKEKFDKIVAERVEAQPQVEQVEISPEEQAALSKKRSEFAKQAKMLKELGTMLGVDENSFASFPTRVGSRGPRGPRALSLFDWAVNGETLSGEENSLLKIATNHGYEKKADLTKAMREAEIDTKNPPAQITFTLKDGAVLTGVKRAVDDEPDDEDETDEDEEISED